MARRPVQPALFTDDVDRFIGRLLAVTAAVLFTFLVIVQVWRWVGR